MNLKRRARGGPIVVAGVDRGYRHGGLEKAKASRALACACLDYAAAREDGHRTEPRAKPPAADRRQSVLLAHTRTSAGCSTLIKGLQDARARQRRVRLRSE